MHLNRTILTSLLAVTGAAAIAAPLGTAFTYQGKLADDGQPATGIYDFVFSLYNSPSNPDPIYTGILVEDVPVTNGLFSTEIDFDADLFTGQELWMQVAVRPGNETGEVTAVNPRQHITATPYAHFAKRAAVADAAATATNVPWTAVKNLPPSLADGVDNDTTYSAGAGLNLSLNNQFSVNYAGAGNATTAARSDHNHLSQVWIGSTNNASSLRIQNASPSGIALWGRNDQYGSGFQPVNGAGIFGDSSADPGVAGFSNTGPGVYGWISALNGLYDAVKGENPSSTGRAVAGYATATSGANIGVLGQTDSNGGTGVRGYATATTGTTYGGRFSTRSPNGHAIHGVSENSGVAYFDIDNPNNNGTGLEVRTDGKGIAAKFTSGSSSNSAAAVQAVHLGHGDALAATAGGLGNAGNFKLLSDYTNNAALVAAGLGKARGVKAVSSTGEALRAESGGTAIVAKAPGGTALEIDGGAMRMRGAGVNTSTAVFVHECTDDNTPASPGGNYYTIINHPMCNGNPNAILFITPRIQDQLDLYHTYEDIAISYHSSRARWVIQNTSMIDELGDFDVGDRFNVMVFIP